MCIDWTLEDDELFLRHGASSAISFRKTRTIPFPSCSPHCTSFFDQATDPALLHDAHLAHSRRFGSLGVWQQTTIALTTQYAGDRAARHSLDASSVQSFSTTTTPTTASPPLLKAAFDLADHTVR